MNTRKSALTAIAFITALGGASLALLPPAPAAAQNAPAAPAPQQQDQRPPRQHLDLTRRVEARTAYLKAALQITPAQEAQWDKVAQAMRQDAQDRQKMFEEMRAHRGEKRTAVSRLEMVGRISTARAQQTERFLAAFQPLYASLSDAQKQAADEVMMRHFGHHHHGRA